MGIRAQTAPLSLPYEVMIEGEQGVIEKLIERYSYHHSGDGYVIEYLELLYDVYKGKVKVFKVSGEQLGFHELLQEYSSGNEHVWLVFTVYADLRRRGRYVRTGPSACSLISVNGNKIIEYHVIEESRLIRVEELWDMLESSVRNGREPVLAVVDRNGNPTYYKIERFVLSRLG